MIKAENELLKKLGRRPILVWGARMTGIGFLRFAKKHGLNVVGFADSDASLSGRKISGIEIFPPGAITAMKAAHKQLAVLVAVSIKEDEIIAALGKMGVDPVDCIRYSEFCGSFFTIDITGTCNLRCPSCAYTVPGIRNPAGLMLYGDFVKITDKMLSEVGLVSHICLYSWGEPFLHPELPRFIARCHALGIAAAVSTNLSIESTEKIEEVIKQEPDYLKISTSGFSPEVYNTTHTGGNVDLVKSNLYRIKYLIEKHKASIFVDVNYHMYRNNLAKDL
ncbi:MAG TPA: radical SAM protein, partial [Elusimicrobiales bacterium]|nr:radical SAM protein [Elusimicrobiales bacterium]